MDVVHWVADHGVVVLGGEVWLPASGAPRTPKPVVIPYTWAVADRRPSESHDDCVERARREAVASIEQFAWAGDLAERFGEEDPLFNLTF